MMACCYLLKESTPHLQCDVRTRTHIVVNLIEDTELKLFVG